MVKYDVKLFLWVERFNDSALPLIRKAKNTGFDGVEIPMLELEPINIEKTKKDSARHPAATAEGNWDEGWRGPKASLARYRFRA